MGNFAEHFITFLTLCNKFNELNIQQEDNNY